jgi:precorrin-2 dehydrogenase
MLPISIDLARTRVVLVGQGAAACRRLVLLDEAGAAGLEIFAPESSAELADRAGPRLRRRLPLRREIADAQLVFVAGLSAPAAAEVAALAQGAGVLVNFEDDRGHSDFHSAAVIRRGDLTIAVSTNGKCPGLAGLVREVLARWIGPEWGVRIDELAARRRRWRAAGADPATVARNTRDWAARRNWLSTRPAEASQPPAHPIVCGPSNSCGSEGNDGHRDHRTGHDGSRGRPAAS